ncbi:cupin domain-containing protein [Terriglobus sp.]|uniref:cupin domain-containing protein n=1 Tax=Terriglobus sp. TaxID=1889013 RepID=UPI003B007E7F
MSEISTHAVAELHSFNTLPMEQMSATIARQFVFGEGAMLARIVLEQGAVVPEHSHHNEQISYIVEGALRFRVGGEEKVVRAGEVLIIPPHVPHSAEALERTVDLDIFTPPRQDWITGDDAYLRR